MGLLQRLGGIFTRGAALPQPRPDSGMSSMLAWFASVGAIDTQPIKTTRDQLGACVGWAYAAVNRIGMDVRGAERKLWRRTGKKQDDWQEVPKAEWLPIFTRPNATQMMSEFVQVTVNHMDLAGGAFWHIITSGASSSGRFAGLQIVYPHWVEDPVVDNNGVLTHWRVAVPGRSYRLIPAEDMVWVRYPHPMDPLKALSPVEAYAITHDMDLYARAYASTLLKNRATPELVFTTEQLVPLEAGELMRERWMDRYTDPRSGPAFLGNGFKVQQLGLNIADLKFMELTGASRELILGIYGVPAAMIGLTTDFNRANAQTADATYWGKCIGPRLRLIEESFNELVLPRIMGQAAADFEWGFEPPATEDRDFALNQSSRAFDAGAITLNEFRERNDFDNLGKDGDIYKLPMGASFVSSLSSVTDVEDEEPELPPLPGQAPSGDDPAALPPPDEAGPDQDKPGQAADKDADKRVAAATERFMGRMEALIVGLPAVMEDRSGPSALLKVRMRAAKAEFLERQGKLERGLKSEVRKLFAKDQAKIIARLKSGGEAAAAAAAKSFAVTGYGAVADHVEIRDWAEDELEENSEEWESTLREYILRGIKEGWILAANDIGQSIDWNLYRPEAEKFARDIAGKKIKDIRKTTLNGVRRVIGDGVASGASVNSMADDLRKMFDGFKGYRAETVARTETSASIAQGRESQIDALQERLEMKFTKTWVSVQDDRTRESHVAADGQTVVREEKFDVGGTEIEFPCDPSAPAEEVINCRCVCLYSAE